MADVLERTYFAGPLPIFKLKGSMSRYLGTGRSLSVDSDFFNTGLKRAIETEAKSQCAVSAKK